jgi:hypothetical protein
MLIETSRLLSRMFINKESVVHPTREPVRCAGIAICHDVKWGDRIVPKSWIPLFARNDPDYEVTLVEGLRETIRSGDKVVVVGGGLGVTATVAALRTGPSGTVRALREANNTSSLCGKRQRATTSTTSASITPL